MDKKTYKALKTDEYKSISFLSKEISTTKLSETSYKLIIKGALTICGVEKPISLESVLTKKDGVFLLEGNYKLLMTNFGIDPPKALLGAIKTGDEIEIKFKSVFTN